MLIEFEIEESEFVSAVCESDDFGDSVMEVVNGETDTLANNIVDESVFVDAVRNIIDDHVDVNCECDDYSGQISDLEDDLKQVSEEVGTLNHFMEQSVTAHQEMANIVERVVNAQESMTKILEEVNATAERIDSELKTYVKLKKSLAGKILTYFGMM